MTAQALNQVILKEEEFNLLGFTNEGLIKPQDFGINPLRINSSCWRGYISTYKIDSKSNFLLDQLAIQIKSEDDIILINGIHPKLPSNKLEKKVYKRQRKYEAINLLVEYSGFIVIGKDFVKELYVHMDFHPAWKFKKVYELEIDKGIVLSIRDLSEKMEQYRKILKGDNGKNLNSLKEDEIEDWVRNTFNRKYQK